MRRSLAVAVLLAAVGVFGACGDDTGGAASDQDEDGLIEAQTACEAVRVEQYDTATRYAEEAADRNDRWESVRSGIEALNNVLSGSFSDNQGLVQLKLDEIATRCERVE